MSWIDWLIVIIPVGIIIWLSFYSKRYARDVVDFLAAGRCAGRYVICIGDMMGRCQLLQLLLRVKSITQQGLVLPFGIVF